MDRLFARRAEERTKASENWNEFVRQSADDLLDLDSLDAGLVAFGRDEHDLKAAVLLHKKVSEATAKIVTGPQLLEESTRNNAEIDRLNTEATTAIERIRSDAARKIQALQIRRLEIDRKISHVEDARRLLMQLPKPPAIAGRLRELKSQADAERRIIAEEFEVLEGYRCSGVLTPERHKKSTATIAAAESRMKELSEQASSVEWGSLQ